MKVLFDPDFAGGSWPGPLRGRSAVAGEVWVGEAGFLGILETTLGLGSPPVPTARRVASLIPAVRATGGFWSGSATVDPFATARRLLSWRDFLLLQGWRGQEIGGCPRLSALASVTQGCLPGFADRFLAVENELAHRSAEVGFVSLLAPASSFSPAWRRLFAALSRHGTSVDEAPPTPMPSFGDLSSARAAGFLPTGDGSLQLLRPSGPLEAAEVVAAWLAAQDSLEDTVVISPEPVLDAAFHRHGLPTTGASESAAVDAILPTVPLVLALGMDPADPQQCLDLLLLPVSPVPKGIAVSLASALSKGPAVGSPSWADALAKGLEGIEEADRRATISDRLEGIFRPGSARNRPYPAAEAGRRLHLLERWLRGRIARADDPAPFERALAFALSTADILARSGLVELSASQLDRVVAEASAGLPTAAPFPQEAGLASVASPGGIAGPANRIVWWDFRRRDLTAQGAPPLSVRERAALAATGIELEPRGADAARRAIRWRRPLLLARETLLLVAPRRDSAGKELHPHPMWDEVSASVAHGGRLDLVESSAPFGPRIPVARPRPLRDLPRPQPVWRGPPVALRGEESPSSVEKLLGCSLSYALAYAGAIWPGLSGALPKAARLLGIVTHAVLERVLAQKGLTPQEAAEEAGRVFDNEGPILGAALFLAGAEREQAIARKAVSDAARRIIDLARRLGGPAIEVERTLEAPFLNGVLRGRADVVFSAPGGVLDLKWGSGERAQLLRNGGAVQLAAYAKLLAHEDGLSIFPPVAYFILKSTRLIAQSSRAFPGAEEFQGPGPDRVWAAVEGAAAGARDALARGELHAPGLELDEEPATGLTDGGLSLPPQCAYCDYTVLCGYAFPAGSE